MENRDGTHQRRGASPWVGAVVLLLLVIAAHFPALRAGFLWDDEFWLWSSPITLADDGLLQAWVSTERFDYLPLTASAFWIEWRLFGHEAFGYHAVNLALHALGVGLLWGLLRRLKIRTAWLAAAVFAVHPVTVATVAWITQLKSTLSLVFYLLAAHSFLRSLDEKHDRSGFHSALALLAFVAALLSKTSVVVLPLVLLLLVAWRRGALGRREILKFVPLFGIALLAGLVTVWFQHHRVIGYEIVRPEGLLSRVAAAGWAVWFYLYKALVPSNLAIVYPRWVVEGRSVVAWLPSVTLLAVLIGGWRVRHTWTRGAVVGLGVFIGSLLPVLGLLTTYYSRYSLVSDHWQYLALPVVIVLVSEGARLLLSRLGGQRLLSPACVVAVLAVLSILTFRQAVCYEHEGTFWRTVLARNEGAWVAHNGLGSWLGSQGENEEAIRHFGDAIHLKQDYAMAHNNLGLALARSGRRAEAESSFVRAVEAHPTYAAARANLGRSLAEAGELADGILHLREAVRLSPRLADAHYDLAVALTQQGELAASVDHYRRVTELARERADAHDQLARLLYRLGDRLGALTHVREVVRLRPGDREAQAVLQQLESDGAAGTPPAATESAAD